MASTWLSMVMKPMAVPRASRAESRGRAMAKAEPKKRRRTRAASRMPRPLPPTLGGLASPASWPDTATFRPGRWAAWAVSTIFLASPWLRDWGPLSKVRVAKAMVPSGLIR